ncbi:hypothetical protein E8P82_00590 [Arthrobacter echini]|uniref:Uncharacterized protein n=1 Tax=Arthrobacter echini TaxID=1529066 RepID=A0A4S5E9V5_9MICC|nr:hypothetical protein [Arthrobacter echini]THJ68448.1 hypothetical protein E8P82_00590 [Arthrobacter echini]
MDNARQNPDDSGPGTVPQDPPAPEDSAGPDTAPRGAGATGTDRVGAGAPAGAETTDDPMPSGSVQPELSVGPDTIDLSEPDLAPAQISQDVADAASLEAAAAEARAVAAEAEQASSLVGGPMPRNAPVTRASHDATAPAGGVVEDTEQDSRAGSVAESDPASRERTSPDAPAEVAVAAEASAGPDERPAASGRATGGAGAERTPSTPTAPGAPVASAGVAAGASAAPAPGTRSEDRVVSGNPVGESDGTRVVGRADGAADRAGRERAGTGGDRDMPAAQDEPRTGSNALPLLLVIAAVVVLVGLLIWLVVSLISGLELFDVAGQDQLGQLSVIARE